VNKDVYIKIMSRLHVVTHYIHYPVMCIFYRSHYHVCNTFLAYIVVGFGCYDQQPVSSLRSINWKVDDIIGSSIQPPTILNLTAGFRTGSGPHASHQTFLILFLANDSCLRDYDLVCVYYYYSAPLKLRPYGAIQMCIQMCIL